VLSAVFPAADGQYGVMGGRTPLVAMLGAGLLSVEPTAGPTQDYWLEGGFATMRENSLIVLADTCEPLAELDRDVAWEAIEKARSMPAYSDEEFELRREALELARKRFSLVQTRGKGKRQAGGHPAAMTLV